MFPHSIHLLTTFILLAIQLTNAIPNPNFNPKINNSPKVIQANLAPPPNPTSPPEPTRRLFTVAAFMSPYAPAPGHISGTRMRAEGGIFWLDPNNPLPETGCGDSDSDSDSSKSKSKEGGCPPGNETVLWVDHLGQAWLDSEVPQQVYLDTKTGVLHYLSPATEPKYSFQPGAISTNFMHFGEGTEVCVPSPQPGYCNAGPGNFQFAGVYLNPFWLACPRPGGRGLIVLRYVGGYENYRVCLGGLWMIALDYEGPSPAAGVYL